MSDFSGSTIGERIEVYRRLNGLTREALSDATGSLVGRDVLANIENGRRKDITVSQLVAISAALRVPPTALLFDVTQPSAASGGPDLISERSVDNGTDSTKRRPMTVAEAIDWYNFDLDANEVAEELPALAVVTRQVGAWRRYQRALQGLDRNRRIFDRGDGDIRAQYGSTIEHAWEAYRWAREMDIQGLSEPPVPEHLARELLQSDG